MSKLIGILILLALFWGGKELFNYWERVKAESEGQQAAVVVNSESLPGLPPMYEQSLQIAKEKGAEGLRAWLQQYRRVCADPRLAAIELDYVVLVNKSDPIEARRIYNAVRVRTTPASPNYPRVKQLAKTYE